MPPPISSLTAFPPLHPATPMVNQVATQPLPASQPAATQPGTASVHDLPTITSTLAQLKAAVNAATTVLAALSN